MVMPRPVTSASSTRALARSAPSARLPSCSGVMRWVSGTTPHRTNGWPPVSTERSTTRGPRCTPSTPWVARGSSNHSGAVRSCGRHRAVTVSSWSSTVSVLPGSMPSRAAASECSAASPGDWGQSPSTSATSGPRWPPAQRMRRSLRAPSAVAAGRGSETNVVQMVMGAGAKPSVSRSRASVSCASASGPNLVWARTPASAGSAELIALRAAEVASAPALPRANARMPVVAVTRAKSVASSTADARARRSAQAHHVVMVSNPRGAAVGFGGDFAQVIRADGTWRHRGRSAVG